MQSTFRKKTIWIDGMIQFMPTANQIQLADTTIQLRPYVAELLWLFCQKPGCILSRHDLRHAFLLEHSREDLTESALTQLICSLRRQLGLLDRQKVFIKTLPRIGYIFVGAVQTF
ncbi:DNA-binding transcriptional regulator BaeR [compost metagenome]